MISFSWIHDFHKLGVHFFYIVHKFCRKKSKSNVRHCIWTLKKTGCFTKKESMYYNEKSEQEKTTRKKNC